MGFVTLECPARIAATTALYPNNSSLLLDSVTALLGNEMFSQAGVFDPDAPQRVAGELGRLIRFFPNLVLVSDYIYGDGRQYDDMTEQYRRGLALLDRRCAALCDSVIEVSGGIPIIHKGGLLPETLL